MSIGGAAVTHPHDAGGPPPEYFARVQRRSRPPGHRVWTIHRRIEPAEVRRSETGFRSAEETWEAGRAALAGMGPGPIGSPGAPGR